MVKFPSIDVEELAWQSRRTDDSDLSQPVLSGRPDRRTHPALGMELGLLGGLLGPEAEGLHSAVDGERDADG